MSYKASKVEKKWQEKWKKTKLYKVDVKKVSKDKKYYNLVMFPYPSGDKLHIGHWYAYAPPDSHGRFMRMHGYDVFEPIGFDSFGLPAENYAIKTGVHPKDSIAKNVDYMIKQISAIGGMHDWDKTLSTSNPEYYKWTQWIFLQMYKKGLAYKKKQAVNWCPSCQTVLANEQVQDGTCDRCHSEVEQKDLEQWFWKTRDYADRLLKHDGLDWPEKTKLMQENWIGKSEGINITYDIDGIAGGKITVFTTRPDTNFGATFIVVAPESGFVEKYFDSFLDKKGIEEYVKKAKNKTELERISEGRKKTGVFTGIYAINHLTGKKMPIYVSDFVLAGVGTGCVVGVPGHDIRDFEFALEKGIEIIRVVIGSDGDKSPITRPEQVQEKEGTMINSDFLNGMDIHKATKEIMSYIVKKGWGEKIINYKFKDWLISRQRYWGAPIPIIYCNKCGTVPVPEKDLPVELPLDVEFKLKGDGKSPLFHSKKFMNVLCPVCGGAAKRESETMDTFVCSSWYYLRYPSSGLKKAPFDKELTKKWLPVDMYIGGPEHACMHLLYARFVNMVLHDLGWIDFEEPFKRLVHQGMITKNGAKMSKSKGNVVSPDGFVEQYGSDVFRMYLMFMGPFTQGGDWSDKGIKGIARFVDRVWEIVSSLKKSGKVSDADGLKRALNKTIKRVTEDIEHFQFNTAISALMEFLNTVSITGIDSGSAKILIQLIAPMAPHLAEECWEVLGGKYSIFDSKWPEFDPVFIKSSVVIYAVQINGKLRGTIEMPADASKEDVLKNAKEVPNVAKYLAEGEVVKEIFVPGKIVGFVVKA
jgi:leucyl-tRNA synthetase